MNAPGQYLYENYCLVFGTIFAPKWEGLSEESRSNWAKLELATRIDCTCNSDPMGRCVVHPPADPPADALTPTIAEMSGLVEDFTEGKPLKDYMDDLRGKP